MTINVTVEFNQVTIPDANLSPSADEFLKEFAGCAIFSMIDFFLGYNQVKLDKKYQDLTAFMTLLDVMQMTILSQSVTNLVAQFVRIVLKILGLYLYDQVKVFLDDMVIKRPKTTYNNENMATDIKQYVFEHIQNLDKVLADLEQAGITIAKAKSQFCQARLKIVGYICDANGRHLAFQRY